MKKRVEKEVGRLTKWYAARITQPTTREFNFLEPDACFRSYLNGEDNSVRLIESSAEALGSRWYLPHYEAIALNENRRDLKTFALSAYYSYWSLRFKDARKFTGEYGITSSECDAAAYLSMTIIAGWRNLANQLASILIAGLDTPLLRAQKEGGGASADCRHFWFVLQLYADMKGWAIDTSRYWYPPDMAPYDRVLANWRSKDVKLVSELVLAMANFHVSESKDERNKTLFEFTDDTFRLFPHEIMAFLCLRQWQGLSSPDEYDHPLMQQPLARTPKEVPIPETPLLNLVIEKFKKEHPAAFVQNRSEASAAVPSGAVQDV